MCTSTSTRPAAAPGRMWCTSDMAQLYLRQLLAGRDFATGDAMAGGMQNFVYLIGDRDVHECMIVDPAWDIEGIVAAAAADDMKITGALVTHYHPDHVGGSMF